MALRLLEEKPKTSLRLLEETPKEHRLLGGWEAKISAAPPKEYEEYRPPLTDRQRAEAVITLLGQDPAKTPIEKIGRVAEQIRPYARFGMRMAFPRLRLLETMRMLGTKPEVKLFPPDTKYGEPGAVDITRTITSYLSRAIHEPEKGAKPIGESLQIAYPKIPWQVSGTLGTFAEFEAIGGGQLIRALGQIRTEAQLNQIAEDLMIKENRRLLQQKKISIEKATNPEWMRTGKEHIKNLLLKNIKDPSVRRMLEIQRIIRTPATGYRFYAGVPAPKKIPKGLEGMTDQAKHMSLSSFRRTIQAYPELIDLVKKSGFTIESFYKQATQPEIEPKVKPAPKELIPKEEDILSEYTDKVGEKDVREAWGKFSDEERVSFEKELRSLEKDPSANLFKAIQTLGGIKSYKGDYFKEELRDVPFFLRNNTTGQHVDTIIQELRSLGWHFDSSNELLDAISTQVRSGYNKYGRIGRRPRSIAKAIKYTARIRKAKRPKEVPDILLGKELPYTTEVLATSEQKALAHILMKKKGLTPRQFEYLKNVMVGKRTMAAPEVARKQYVFEKGKPVLATEYKGKEPMTKKEAQELIQAMKGIKEEPGKETVLARTTALVPGHKVTSYKLETLKNRIKKTNMPFDDVDTLARLKGLDPDMLTEEQANELLIDLNRASKLSEGERIRYFVKKPALKDKVIEKEYKNIEAHEGKIRASGFSGGRKNIATGKDYHSPFYQSFKLSIPQSLKDVRLMMGDLEVKSGLPLYQHYLEISKAESLKEAELKEVTRILTRNIDPSLKRIESAELQQKLSAYFDALYNRRPLPKLTEEERIIGRDIEEVMNKYKPFIKKYRFMQWVRSYRAGENEGKGITDIPNVDQRTLKEGYDIWELQGEKALDEWLKTKDFGVIDVGYVPRAILGGKARMIPYRIDAFSRKALKPRTAEIDLSNVPLIPRIERYINAVLNLKYMEKPIQTLDDTLNMASMGGHLPKETIARLSTWIDRAKGYAGVPSIPGKILTKIARQFFRVIVVRPFLWLRNLFQRVVTVPYKTPVMKLDFKPITTEEKRYFDTFISQMEEMEKSYLLFLRGQYTEIPILRQYSELSERVGRIYPITDEMNRLSVFKKSLHYYNRAISDYVNRKLPLGILKNKVGYNLMRSYEQRHFLELLDKNPIEAGRWAAKWNVDNSQWLYKMSERSVAEMDEAVRPFFNLFVWSKGLLQNLGANIYKGTKGRTWDEKRSGIVAIIGIIIASDLAQRCIQKITAARKRGRYDYNILNSMFWSLGGATLGMLNEGQEALSELVFAYQDGDRARKRRALSNALRMADRIAMFQLPFLEPGLNVLEAMTDRQYISPLYNTLMKKPKRIRRDFIEKIAHSIFGRVTQTKKKSKVGDLRLLR